MVDVVAFGPEQTYDDAAAIYASESERGWDWAAERLVELAAPAVGGEVLDVACGTGGVALRLARRVGRSGEVQAIDISREMRHLAYHRTVQQNLPQVRVQVGDMHKLRYREGRFSRVTCGLGLFLAHDPSAVAAELWRVVRPGGRLALSTVGVAFFSPLYGVFVDALLEERPGEDVTVPWERTETVEQVAQLLAAAGIPDAQVSSERRQVAIPDGDAWWRIVMGTGIRRLATLLTPEQTERVREACARHMETAGVDEVTFEVVFAVSQKPR